MIGNFDDEFNKIIIFVLLLVFIGLCVGFGLGLGVGKARNCNKPHKIQSIQTNTVITTNWSK